MKLAHISLLSVLLGCGQSQTAPEDRDEDKEFCIESDEVKVEVVNKFNENIKDIKEITIDHTHKAYCGDVLDYDIGNNSVFTSNQDGHLIIASSVERRVQNSVRFSGVSVYNADLKKHTCLKIKQTTRNILRSITRTPHGISLHLYDYEDRKLRFYDIKIDDLSFEGEQTVMSEAWSVDDVLIDSAYNYPIPFFTDQLSNSYIRYSVPSPRVKKINGEGALVSEQKVVAPINYSQVIGADQGSVILYATIASNRSDNRLYKMNSCGGLHYNRPVAPYYHTFADLDGDFVSLGQHDVNTLFGKWTFDFYNKADFKKLSKTVKSDILIKKIGGKRFYSFDVDMGNVDIWDENVEKIKSINLTIESFNKPFRDKFQAGASIGHGDYLIVNYFSFDDSIINDMYVHTSNFDILNVENGVVSKFKVPIYVDIWDSLRHAREISSEVSINNIFLSKNKLALQKSGLFYVFNYR